MLGAGVTVGPFCHLQGRVSAGEGCTFHTGVAVGGPPMDRSYSGEETEVVIGRGNRFFEYATVHRATGPGGATVIGDDNMVMAYVHIAHNCRVGSGCVLTNWVQLGGYATVGEGAVLGGLTGVHQHCRIGRLAMVGACSYVVKDIPPFTLAAGRPCRVRGVNAVGMARAGLPAETVAAVRRAFRLIYRSGLNLGQAMAGIEAGIGDGPARFGPGAAEVRLLLDFCRSSTRGIELRAGPESDADSNQEAM
jgi:UDP-N-acetylglucosamine acyltransferase